MGLYSVLYRLVYWRRDCTLYCTGWCTGEGTVLCTVQAGVLEKGLYSVLYRLVYWRRDCWVGSGACVSGSEYSEKRVRWENIRYLSQVRYPIFIDPLIPATEPYKRYLNPRRLSNGLFRCLFRLTFLFIKLFIYTSTPTLLACNVADPHLVISGLFGSAGSGSSKNSEFGSLVQKQTSINPLFSLI